MALTYLCQKMSQYVSIDLYLHFWPITRRSLVWILVPPGEAVKTGSGYDNSSCLDDKPPISIYFCGVQDCCICYDTLAGPSSYGEGKPGALDVVQLSKCSHRFHRLCLLALYESNHKVTNSASIASTDSVSLYKSNHKVTNSASVRIASTCSASSHCTRATTR